MDQEANPTSNQQPVTIAVVNLEKKEEHVVEEGGPLEDPKKEPEKASKTLNERD